MEALHDVVKAGKARYLGASSMWAWQFAKMQHAADLHGWTRFVSMQNQYSLLQREEEREMFGLLADQGVGSIPWSPLAKGRLARPWGEQTDALRHRPASASALRRRRRPADRRRRAAVAEARGVPMAQVALAWVLQQPGRQRPDRRRHQAAPPRRRRRRARRRSSPTTRSQPRGAVRPAPADSLLRTTRRRRGVV